MACPGLIDRGVQARKGTDVDHGHNIAVILESYV